MRDVEQLQSSLISVEAYIERVLKNRITHPYAAIKNLGARLWGLERFYRTRGILKYLLDADIEAFFSDLTREALTYITLFRAHREGMAVSEEYVDGSTYLPFAGALAAGNFELCAEMDELLPAESGLYDDDELFAFTFMLRRLAVGNRDEIDEARRKLAEVSADSERSSAVMEMVEGLVEENEKTFNSGLATYLATYEKISPAEASELSPGQEYVSIEALAFIQLAKRRNLEIQFQHRMIPTELQDARPTTPTDGYPSWPG